MFNEFCSFYYLQLNTDGIDIKASNVTIYNCDITNYDDAIVVKPSNKANIYSQCTSDILIYNNRISYSLGLTVGSVAPSEDHNCVSGVVFRDCVMYRPIKALYLKSNPGDEGTALIENVVYENIEIQGALQWTIWVGPQQQKQPGGAIDTGCDFLYPLQGTCPTNALVTFQNIQFRNIFAWNTLPLFESPGVIMCDEKNPCKDIVFDNVTNFPFDGTVEEAISMFPVPLPGKLFPLPNRDWDISHWVSLSAKAR